MNLLWVLVRVSLETIAILLEAEAGSPIKAVCAAHNIRTATYPRGRESSEGWGRRSQEATRAEEETGLVDVTPPRPWRYSIRTQGY